MRLIGSKIMAKLCLMFLALIAAPALAFAQTYPSQPIRIVMPYPAGGSGDTVARILGQNMNESMGQPVVVDNRPGGSAVIGSEIVVRAAPDGYTLLLTFDPPHTTLPYILRKVPFDAAKGPFHDISRKIWDGRPKAASNESRIGFASGEISVSAGWGKFGMNRSEV